jgi:hypothetical protein
MSRASRALRPPALRLPRSGGSLREPPYIFKPSHAAPITAFTGTLNAPGT